MKYFTASVIVLGAIAAMVFFKKPVGVPHFATETLSDEAKVYLMNFCQGQDVYVSTVPAFPAAFSINEADLQGCDENTRLDANRDGHPDLVFPISFFASNREFGVWIYSTLAKRYEQYGSIVSDDHIETMADGRLITQYHGAGNTWYIASYRIDETQKKLIKDEEGVQIPEPPTPDPSLAVYPKPHIDFISPPYAKTGDKIKVVGKNFLGFEADLTIWIQNAKGKKGILYADRPSSDSTQMNIVVPDKACTIDTSYSGLPCPEYIILSPGNYQIFTQPWDAESNHVPFTLSP